MTQKHSKSHRSNKGERDVIGAKQDAQSSTQNAKKRDSGNALQFYEDRFKNLLELSSEWYWEQDENYRFTRVVEAGVEQTGIEPPRRQDSFQLF
jgi:PAS domain-containing protein